MTASMTRFITRTASDVLFSSMGMVADNATHTAVGAQRLMQSRHLHPSIHSMCLKQCEYSTLSSCCILSPLSRERSTRKHCGFSNISFIIGGG